MARGRPRKTEAAPPKKGRPLRVELHPDWHQMAVKRLDATGLKYSALADDLSKAVGRSVPWSEDAVSDWVQKRTTDEMTRAVCDYLGLTYPVYAAATDEGAQWAALGDDLRRYAPQVFHDILAQTTAIVAGSQASERALERLMIERQTAMKPKK